MALSIFSISFSLDYHLSRALTHAHTRLRELTPYSDVQYLPKCRPERALIALEPNYRSLTSSTPELMAATPHWTFAKSNLRNPNLFHISWNGAAALHPIFLQ